MGERPWCLVEEARLDDCVGGVCSRLGAKSASFTPSVPGGLTACGHRETTGACSLLGMSQVALSANELMAFPV